MAYEKLDLWELVCTTNPNNTKDASLGGRKITSVDAYSRIYRATELWGPFGNSWGVKGEEYMILPSDKCLYKAILFYPEGEVPIMSDIEMIFHSGKRDGKYNDDWSKKVSTDALTKGLSKLGFNADIYLHKFEDDKYVAYVADFENNPIPFMTSQIESLLTQKTEPDDQAFRDEVNAAVAKITDKDTLSHMFRKLKEGAKMNKLKVVWEELKEGDK